MDLTDLHFIALTEDGGLLAQKLAAETGGQWHGLNGRMGAIEPDQGFDHAIDHIRDLFLSGNPVVGICASGILIRAVAGHLNDKWAEPPVLSISEDGAVVVPLLGGHHGGNLLASRLAKLLDATPALTTAGDRRFGLALDAPPSPYVLADGAQAKPVMAKLLAGTGVALIVDLPENLTHLAQAWQEWLSPLSQNLSPDYIDPGFHHAALNINHNDDHTSPQNASVNLDGFAMPPEMLRHLAEQQSGDLLIIEGVMGLYDGGAGSAVTLAQHLGLPIILVMDCRGQAETSAEIAAALKHRLAAEGVDLAGVILNRISTPRHGDGIKTHCHELGVPVLGALPNAADIDMPSRHLGLVQAFDLAAAGRLNHLLDQAASMMTEHLDLDAIMNAASPLTPSKSPHEALPPPGCDRLSCWLA